MVALDEGGACVSTFARSGAGGVGGAGHSARGLAGADSAGESRVSGRVSERGFRLARSNVTRDPVVIVGSFREQDGHAVVEVTLRMQWPMYFFFPIGAFAFLAMLVAGLRGGLAKDPAGLLPLVFLPFILWFMSFLFRHSAKRAEAMIRCTFDVDR